MDKIKKYWLTGTIITAVVVILAAWGLTSLNQKNTTPDPHAGHNHGTATQETTALNGQADQSSQTDAPDSDALKQYLKEQDTIMDDMMTNMKVEPSGNASIDFLVGMIPHHDSAIEMSESYLKYGGANPELKKLAEDIISAQTGEIEQMQQMIERLEASGEQDQEKEQGYLTAYDQMMGSHAHMSHGTSSAADVEQAFAEGMMMHHQMAVEMAKAILDYTDDEEVRKLSEAIIDAQEKEIKQMSDILNQS